MPRLFTVHEANELLPTLTAVLKDLIVKREKVQVRRRELAVLEVKARSNGRESASTALQARESLENLLAEMNEQVDQITSMGCQLKDLAQGLIDFPAIRDGREVYLCWKLGEDRVAYWHEQEVGFADRKPL